VPIGGIRTANQDYVHQDECAELRDSLKSEIRNHDILEKSQEVAIGSLQKQVEQGNQIAAEKDVQIGIKKEENDRQGRQITWLKIQRTALAAATAILAVIVIVHH